MVQRKAVNKLGIQSESKNHVKSEIRSSSTRKPSSQHQDMIRNKGGSELMKKMKKARSFKASDMDSFGRSLRREGSRLSNPSTYSSQKKNKPSPVKISSGSPNYMKPTTSSDARKESLQVSPSSQTPDKHKRSPKNSNYSKASCALKKSMKVLKKASSLKPVRPSMKKSSGAAALYPKMNVSRATCSSTLKDSKFPAPVLLHPGGTELEGTSVMRVCPYTYCSLNGHHHAPLPPLKRFLSARRRLIKTQKNMKLKGLSSPRNKWIGDQKKEIDTGQMGFVGDDPMVLEAESDRPEASPLVEEDVGADFFVEIYAKPREEVSGGRNIPDPNDEPRFDLECFEEISVVRDDGTVPGWFHEETDTETEEDDGAAESQIDETYSQVSSEHNSNYRMDVPIALPQFTDNELHVEEDQDMENPPCLVEEDRVESDNGEESEGVAENEVDESVPEATDMDWEEQVTVTAFPDRDIADFSISSDDDESNLIVAAASGLHDEPAFEQDDSVSACYEAISDVEEIQDGAEGEGWCSESSVSCTASDETTDASNGPIQNPLDLVLYLDYKQDEPEFSSQMGTDGSCEIIICNTSSPTSTENTFEEPTEEAGEEVNGDSGADDHSCHGQALTRDSDEVNVNQLHCSTDVKNETRVGKQEDNSSPEADPNTNHHVVGEDECSGQMHPDSNAEASESVVVEVDDAEVVTSDHGPEEVLPNAKIEDATGRMEQVEDTPMVVNMQAPSDWNVDMDTKDQSTGQSNAEIEVPQCNEKPQDNNSSQEAVADKSIPPVAHCSSDYQSEDDNRIENDNGSEKDPTEVDSSKISISIVFHKEESSSAEDSSRRRADRMQIEDDTKMDPAETCLTAVKGESIVIAGNNPDSPPSKTWINKKPKIASKRVSEDSMEIRTFNPRAPRFLQIEPDPEAEKVDLRHQMMDERKSSEEWMLDYALRQAVTKLAPARKRRVALLVEAFETVAPLPKFETHMRHSASTFTHARPIQACS